MFVTKQSLARLLLIGAGLVVAGTLVREPQLLASDRAACDPINCNPRQLEIQRGAVGLAQLEPCPATTQLEIMQQKVAMAKAELKVAVATKEEAHHRWNSMMRHPHIGSQDDVRGAKLTYTRCVLKEMEKRAAYEEAQRELDAYLTTAFEGRSSPGDENHH